MRPARYATFYVALNLIGACYAAEKWVRPIERAESKLRQIARKADGPQEIYALLSEGGWGGIGQRFIFLFADRAILHCDDGNGRTRERILTTDEFNELRNWISKNNVDRLPKFDEMAADGIQYEYFHIAHNGSEHRVFMNNPPGAPIGAAAVFFGGKPAAKRLIYGELTRRMLKLDERPIPVTYESLKNLPGFKVVHCKENGEIAGISQLDSRLVAGVWSPEKHQPIWYSVNDSGLSANPVASPNGYKRESDFDYLTDIAIEQGPLAGKHLSVSWTNGKEGFWIGGKNNERELLARGIFGREPIISSDGTWIVASKTHEGCMWDVPNGVVRIHIPTKRVFPVDLPAADNFDPLAWLEVHKKVLLYQERDRDHSKAGPAKREFYLLDPASGAHEKVEGDFRPLFFAHARYTLQASKLANQVWAALTDGENETDGTSIGRYDTRSFQFKPVQRLPGVQFDSSGIYVDEAARLVWLTINGDLLRFSLPSDALSADIVTSRDKNIAETLHLIKEDQSICEIRVISGRPVLK